MKTTTVGPFPPPPSPGFEREGKPIDARIDALTGDQAKEALKSLNARIELFSPSAAGLLTQALDSGEHLYVAERWAAGATPAVARRAARQRAVAEALLALYQNDGPDDYAETDAADVYELVKADGGLGELGRIMEFARRLHYEIDQRYDGGPAE